jgi:hypothetical protein
MKAQRHVRLSTVTCVQVTIVQHILVQLTHVKLSILVAQSILVKLSTHVKQHTKKILKLYSLLYSAFVLEKGHYLSLFYFWNYTDATSAEEFNVK